MPFDVSEILLWIAFAAMTAAVVAAVLRPLSRSAVAGQRRAVNVALYRDQLAEIDRDLERGLIAAGEAEAARLEVSRRLLAEESDGHSGDGIAPARTFRRAVAVAVIVIGPALTLGLYLSFGNPGLPSAPLQTRLDQPVEELPVEALVVRIEQRLAADPNDLEGWRLIAPVYVRLGRYDDAIIAYQRVLDLGDRTPVIWVGYGEALIALENGMIGEAARSAFLAGLQAVPHDRPARARALYFLGLADLQDGCADRAVAKWEMLAMSAGDAPWATGLERDLAAARDALAAGAKCSD